jgi:hypothetical protein
VKRSLLLLAFLLVGCDEKHANPVRPTQVTPPTVAQCAPFEIEFKHDRNVSSQMATIRGASRIEVAGYGVKAEPAVFGPMTLDAFYEVRGADARGCWSNWGRFFFASNPSSPEPPSSPVPGPVPPKPCLETTGKHHPKPCKDRK